VFFLKPEIPKLKHRNDEKALIKALSNKDDAIRLHAAIALLEIGSDSGLGAIERCFSQCCPPAIDENGF
jgi:HEAT repeat protein